MPATAAAPPADAIHVPTFSGMGIAIATMSHPLLEGLIANHPKLADEVVDRAFRSWEAGRKIGAFILKGRKSGNAPRTARRREHAHSHEHSHEHSHHHWLFRNLSSLSRLERQAASRIFAQGSVLTERRHWQILELYWELLVRWVERHERTHWNVSIDEAGAALEWIATLKHVALLPDHPLLAFAMSKGKSNGNGNGGVAWLCEVIWKLSSCLLPRTSASIAAPASPGNGTAVASGSSLLQLTASTQSLASAKTASDGVPESPHLLNMTSRGAVQRVLISLVDLVDCMVLHGVETPPEASTKPKPPREPTFLPGGSTGTVSQHIAAIMSENEKKRKKPMTRLEQLQKVHKYLWSEKDADESSKPRPKTLYQRHAFQRQVAPLSPLACLIGAYHLLSQQMQDPMGPYPTKSMTVCCSLIQKLIDPTSSPKVVTLPLDADDAAKDKSEPLRLIATFDVPPEPEPKSSSPTNESETTKKPKKKTKKKNRESAPPPQQPPGGAGRWSAAATSESSSDRLAAAAVARIFSVVYGSDNPEGEGGEHKEEAEDEEDDDIIEGGIHRNGESEYDLVDDDILLNGVGEDDNTIEEENQAAHEEGEAHMNDAANEDHVQSLDMGVDPAEDADEGGGVHQEHDEEIDSDDVDDDDDEGEDDDDIGDEDDDDEEGHGEETHDIMLDRFQDSLMDFDGMDVENVLDIAEPSGASMLASAAPLPPASERAPASASQPPHENVQQYNRSFVKGCMEVLLRQHLSNRALVAQPVLTFNAEQALLASIMNIVKPAKKPVNSRIIMRRAPTQEEFFRGSLSRNPITLSMLQTSTSGASASEEGVEPTIKDLRQHIANDLQMGDSAEMLELLVAGKIIDVSLKLRVVHQTVWKTHLMDNSGGSLSSLLSSSALGGARGFALGAGRVLPAGSGLSMILSSGFGERSRTSTGRAISADTPLSSLPPMVVTYRLTGVDGEATEDTITTLEDPEAPSDRASPEEIERLMEKEYGITRLVTNGRGISALLRSVEKKIRDTLRRIRRDDIGLSSKASADKNPSRAKFKKDPPYPGLSLLWCCAKLPSNRKLLLECRAPTILLRLLMNVLHSLDVGSSQQGAESNGTAKMLQELIEILATDISTVSASPMEDTDDQEISGEDDAMNDAEQDASTLRLLLSSIESTQLSTSLRGVIAKLLPYLTYGQVSLSRELASDFVRHVEVNSLADGEAAELIDISNQTSALMDTFVQASISLPANEVCNSLRSELVSCGFVEKVASFFLREIPNQPPPWSAPLWSKGSELPKSKRKGLETNWRVYINRLGLRSALKMLIGLSKQHSPTQLYLANFKPAKSDISLLQACHWMEATSDFSASHIHMNGLGLTAETLLDELAEGEANVSDKVNAVRRKTRNRKKEIAMARRNKTLVKMNASLDRKRPLEGSSASAVKPSSEDTSEQPMTTRRSSKRHKTEEPKAAKLPAATAKPSWMTEMENMEEETGLTCAVCQEGRTLQPSELLGLYAYVKKVSIPSSQCGGRSNIDGTVLLKALPPSLPDSLLDVPSVVEWFAVGKAAGEDLSDHSFSAFMSASASSGRRGTYFTTTVSAGNAIHISCHEKARQADRNHPKAPKSEWEGASLRNSRVNCNVILPLVSSRSSKVPLVAVDQALTDHQTAVSNLLGARPKSMLWTVLHDARLTLLRMAYGESLSVDCCGGSLSSNAQLVFYQLLSADMFEKDAQVDAPETSQHARNLSAGFLAARAIVTAEDRPSSSNSTMLRAIADSATMATLSCILFHNVRDEFAAPEKEASEASTERDAPHPKRRWMFAKDTFLRGLLNCAGRRHAMGVDSSGCITGRGNSSGGHSRSATFTEWDGAGDNDANVDLDPTPSLPLIRRKSKASIEEIRTPLRPMIAYYAMMDQLSSDFVLNMDDVKVEGCANRLVQVIEDCHSAKSIDDLLSKAKVTLSHDEIVSEFEKGMIFA